MNNYVHMRFQIDEHVCLFFLKKCAPLSCSATYVHYYQNSMRLFIFEKIQPCTLIRPCLVIWSLRVFKVTVKDKDHEY